MIESLFLVGFLGLAVGYLLGIHTLIGTVDLLTASNARLKKSRNSWRDKALRRRS